MNGYKILPMAEWPPHQTRRAAAHPHGAQRTLWQPHFACILPGKSAKEPPHAEARYRMTRNFSPASVWTGDNLHVMRGINSRCVDLIYLDPPFNSNRTYAAPIGSKAARGCVQGYVDAGRRGRL
ncbi:MAG: hypothetical protein GDA52_09810 [Rhodobacteraceae bacterium]|nr:hypothetical protein [Paracoccaceae bacterium]